MEVDDIETDDGDLIDAAHGYHLFHLQQAGDAVRASAAKTFSCTLIHSSVSLIFSSWIFPRRNVRHVSVFVGRSFVLVFQ